MGSYPSDHLGQQISRLIQSNVEVREFFTSSVFIPNGNKDGISKLNTTYLKIIESESAVKKIRHAIKSRVLPKRAISSLVDIALDQNIITVDEAKLIRDAEHARLDAIQVDSFTNDEYLKNA